MMSEFLSTEQVQHNEEIERREIEQELEQAQQAERELDRIERLEPKSECPCSTYDGHYRDVFDTPLDERLLEDEGFLNTIYGPHSIEMHPDVLEMAGGFCGPFKVCVNHRKFYHGDTWLVNGVRTED